MDENYLMSMDENNKPMISSAYYENIIQDNITAYMDDKAIKEINGNDLLAIFKQTYKQVFTPTKNTFPQTKCNIPYTEYNIQTLYNIYIDIALSYKIPPSLFAFSILTGIQEDTAKKYLTPSQLETINIRREMLRNSLYSDRMGRIVLANNDSSYGLEYEKKNTIERLTVKQGLALNDLPKLEKSQ